VTVGQSDFDTGVARSYRQPNHARFQAQLNPACCITVASQALADGPSTRRIGPACGSMHGYPCTDFERSRSHLRTYEPCSTMTTCPCRRARKPAAVVDGSQGQHSVGRAREAMIEGSRTGACRDDETIVGELVPVKAARGSLVARFNWLAVAPRSSLTPDICSLAG